MKEVFDLTGKDVEVELPSDRKFGLFFSFVFAVAAGYSMTVGYLLFSYSFLATCILLLFLSIFFPFTLASLNKLWMRLGVLLGWIISPLIIGMLFFVLIVPLALFLKIVGRDELQLKARLSQSHWIYPEEQEQIPTRFKDQF